MCFFCFLFFFVVGLKEGDTDYHPQEVCVFFFFVVGLKEGDTDYLPQEVCVFFVFCFFLS